MEETDVTQGHMQIALGSRVDQQGLWEADFIVPRRLGGPWFSHEDVIGLFE